MIVEWLVRSLVTVVVSIVSVIPAPAVPDEITGLPTLLDPVESALGGIANWLPVTLLVTFLALVGAAWAAGAGVRVVRTIISHVTGGGGAT